MKTYKITRLPTFFEFTHMTIKDRKRFCESLGVEEKEQFLRLIAAEPCSTESEWDAEIEVSDGVFRWLFELISFPDRYAGSTDEIIATSLPGFKAAGRESLECVKAVRELAKGFAKEPLESRLEKLIILSDFRTLDHGIRVSRKLEALSLADMSLIKNLSVVGNKKLDMLTRKRKSESERHKAIGKKNEDNLKKCNEERASLKPEYGDAVDFALGRYRDEKEKNPKGFWKYLLGEVCKKYPGCFVTPDSLRMAVRRKDDERRGKHDRRGKKRGKYKPRK